MFALWMVGKETWFAVSVHGNRNWTEGKKGILRKLVREGDEWVATVETSEGLIKYYEADIVSVELADKAFEKRRKGKK